MIRLSWAICLAAMGIYGCQPQTYTLKCDWKPGEILVAADTLSMIETRSFREGQPAEKISSTVGFELQASLADREENGRKSIIATLTRCTVEDAKGVVADTAKPETLKDDFSKHMAKEMGDKYTMSCGIRGEVISCRHLPKTGQKAEGEMAAAYGEIVGKVAAYLPEGPVTVGQTWKISRSYLVFPVCISWGLIQESVECKLVRVSPQQGLQVALIEFDGATSDCCSVMKRKGTILFDVTNNLPVSFRGEMSYKNREQELTLINSAAFRVAK